MTANLKIRFRLPNGEEFEAEGTREFIEQQRALFLSLIGQKQPRPRAFTAAQPEEISAPSAPGHINLLTPEKPLPAEPLPTLPSYLRRASAPTVEAASAATLPDEQTASAQRQRLWQQLCKEEGELLVLRRKSRLTPQEAALLILAAAQSLTSPTGYSALLLSRALKKSGFETGRLDRLLIDEIKQEYLTARGVKRNRVYRLTPAGFARAFVLAQKKVGETF